MNTNNFEDMGHQQAEGGAPSRAAQVAGYWLPTAQ